MKWNNIINDGDLSTASPSLPEPGRPIVIVSRIGLYFTGQRAEYGDTLRIVSKCELVDSGDIMQLTTGSIDPRYFTKWAYLDE